MYTSGLRRAVETATIIAKAMGAEIVVDDRVRERMNWDGGSATTLEAFMEEWDKASADRDYVPTDYRFVGLHRAAGYILGVDPTEAPPRIALADATRPLDEPYVCVAAQSTMQAKYWNNPTGWRDVPFEGSWYPHAFVGSMASLQRYVEGSSSVLPTRVEDAFNTMAGELAVSELAAFITPRALITVRKDDRFDIAAGEEWEARIEHARSLLHHLGDQ